MLHSILLILLTLLFSAFFSGMEIAFTSKNRLKLELDRKQSRLFDRIASIFERHQGQYITTILVGNNIALVLYSLYMSILLRTLFSLAGWESMATEGSVLIETAVSTILIIFMGEFIPKSIFKNNPTPRRAISCQGLCRRTWRGLPPAHRRPRPTTVRRNHKSSCC